MSLTLFLLICLILWWLLSRGSTAHAGKAERTQQAIQYRRNEKTATAREATRPTYQPSNSGRPYVLRKPKGDCICGCNGVPLTHLPEYSIDYNKYRICPARKRRKSTKVYIDDSGQIAQWKSASVRRSSTAQSKRAAERRQREENNRQKKLALKREQELQLQAKAEQWAEAGRIGRVFNTCLAREHSKWVLKHDKGLKERYLSAKKAKAA